MYSFYLKFKAVHPESVLIILEDDDFCWNYVISKLKEARVSYYIINRTTGYKEEDKFISEDKEAFKRYLPEAKKYVLIKSKAEAVKFKIDKLLDYPDDAIEKLNKIERILEE